MYAFVIAMPKDEVPFHYRSNLSESIWMFLCTLFLTDTFQKWDPSDALKVFLCLQRNQRYLMSKFNLRKRLSSRPSEHLSQEKVSLRYEEKGKTLLDTCYTHDNKKCEFFAPIKSLAQGALNKNPCPTEKAQRTSVCNQQQEFIIGIAFIWFNCLFKLP